MKNLKTHFEQVPLGEIREIIEIRLEEITEHSRIAEQTSLDGSSREGSTWSEKRELAMSETELKFPEWQIPLQELLLEFDRKKATQKTLVVESLILERLLQLNHQTDGHGEKEAINDALNILRVVKRDKLDFPDWN